MIGGSVVLEAPLVDSFEFMKFNYILHTRPKEHVILGAA